MTNGTWDGAAYADIATLQRELAGQSIDSLTWRGDEDVLDLGCGDGRMTHAIAARVPRGRVTGIDLSPAQIAFAQRLPGAPNVLFTVGDALALPFGTSFDLAVSFNTLHWIHDLERAFGELRRVLRNGGRIAIRCVCAGQKASLEETLMQTAATPAWAAHFRGLERPFEHRPPEGLRAVAESAGFSAQVETDSKVWHFGSQAALRSWMKATMSPWFSVLPEERRDAFGADAVAAYEALVGREGEFRFMQCRLTGVAR